MNKPEIKVQTLQDKMRAVNALSEQEKMSKLENQAPKTAAQVDSTAKQVKNKKFLFGPYPLN